jgi:hypothetical protein
MASLHLYEITEKYKSLLELSTSDELPPEVIADTIESIDAEWHDKAVAVAGFIRNLEHSADGIKAAADAMKKRAERLQRRADQLTSYLQFQMELMGKKRIEHDMFVLSIKKNPPSVVIDDQSLIPDIYLIKPEAPPPYPDKTSIARALKSGEEVSGCHLVQGERLDISA